MVGQQQDGGPGDGGEPGGQVEESLQGVDVGHARAPAASPAAWVRLRDIATTLGITERSALLGIVTGLTAAGYVTKDTGGRRCRLSGQVRFPLRCALARDARRAVHR